MAGFSVTFSVVDNATKTINDINKKLQSLRAPLDQQAKAMSKFMDVSGLQKVSDGFSAIARTSADAFSSIARIVPVMGAITGATTIAGVFSLVKGFTDLGYQLERTADYLGTSTTNLQTWQNAVKLAGGNVDDLNEGMKELAKTGYDAALGRNAEAMQRFTRAGISANDLLHESADQLMPRVLSYINSFTNARDRETVAMQMGGKALYELNEDFRLSGKSYAEWMEAAKRYGSVMDPTQLQKYREAVGQLDVAFTGLGNNISMVLATALTPLIKEFSEWVQTHQPQIIEGVNKIADSLVWLANNLDTVKRVAEIIVGVFAAKWALGIVASIAQVTLAIGTLNAGLLTTLTRLGLIGAAGAGAFAAWRTMTNPQGADAAANKAGEWNINKWLDPFYLAGRAKQAIFGGGGAAGGPQGAGTVPPATTTPGGVPAAPGASTGTGPQGQFYTGSAPASFAEGHSTGWAKGGFNFAGIRAPQGGFRTYPSEFAGVADTARLLQKYGQGGYNTISKIFNRWAPPTDKNNTPQLIARAAQWMGVSPDQPLNLNDPDTLAKMTGVMNRNEFGGVAQVPQEKVAGYVNQYLANANERGGGELGSPNSAPSPAGTPGGGGAGTVVDQMVALAGTRGAAVREFLRDPSGKIARDPDLGLWCAEFTNSYLRRAGVPGTGSLMAASFAQWGHQVAANDVTKGDVLLNYNRKHVGVATGRTRIGPGGNLEVEEVSSNSLGPGGEVMNLPGTRWRSDVEVRRSPELAAIEAKGSPMSVAAANGGGKGVNGSVDITVTHKNAPPGTQIAANSSGDGINLAGPRVEQQQMSAP